MKPWLLPFILILLCSSCSDLGVPPEDRPTNILVRYGVGARNELNTFNNTITKDLIIAGTATTGLVLSGQDIGNLVSGFQEIGIFNYPDTFVAEHGDTVTEIVPFETYVLRLNVGSLTKNLYWEDSIISPDLRAARLREALRTVRRFVESTPEYKRLPPAMGGYL